MIEGLTQAEVVLIEELVRRRVRFMVVGMSAAILQEAPGVTQDVDLWFASGQGEEISAACKRAGATYYWRSLPPEIDGPGVEQIDVVFHCHGLGNFAAEYPDAIDIEIAPGLPVKVLPLPRIIASKRAADRPKDRAVLPMLEDLLIMRQT